MKFLQKTYKGFTLIELLIVIAIIGILSVAFLPVLRGSTAGARDTARVSGANDILTAIAKLEVDGTRPTANATGNACLDFTSTYGSKIREEMGRTPKVHTDNTAIFTPSGCFYFLTYEGTTPTQTNDAGDVVTRYAVVVEVESTKSANFIDATTSTYTAGDLDTALDTWALLLAKSTGTVPVGNVKNFYITSK